MSILVCDSGATSAKWAVTSGSGTAVRYITTEGINASQSSPASVAASIASMRSQLAGEDGSDIERIYFYGAGCVGGEADARIAAALAEAFPAARISVADDLLGAARALHGHSCGVAAILGTGAACGYYDGCCIARRIPSGGYILGDEGSGASMGRELLALVCKGLLDSDLHEAFASRYPDLDYPEIVRRTYREPGANRFLASFAPFLADNIRLHQAQSIVDGCFEAFISRFYRPLGVDSPLGIVGSIASAFAPQLGAVAARGGVELLAPVQSPLQRLVAFHSADAE